MIQYNDYELLYLISESEPEALDILYKKYMNLIGKRIKSFRIQERYKEDFMQEGLMVLDVAIQHFDPHFTKSFNKYFDLILQRKFMQLLMKEKNYIYSVDLALDEGTVQDVNHFVYEPIVHEHISISCSTFEDEVYQLYLKHYRPREIAIQLHCNIKRVYNCLFRIKEKIKQITN